MARLPEGALMQRAAAGSPPPARGACCGGCTARGSCCSSAAATTAATPCTRGPARPARRGRRPRCWSAPGPIAGGAARRCGRPAAVAGRGRRAGPWPRSRGRPHRRRAWSASAARAGCASRRPSPLAGRARAPRATVVAVDLPSGVDADTGEVSGAGRARRRDGHLRHATSRACSSTRAPSTRGGASWSTSGSARTCAEPDVEACRTPTSPRCCRGPAARATSTAAAWSASSPARDRTRAPPCSPSAGALRGGAGAVRYAGRARGRGLARFPETLVADTLAGEAGRVQAWVVGPGLGAGERRRGRRRGARPDRAGARRRRRAAVVAARRDLVCARTAPTVLTPHAGEARRAAGRPREEVEAARLAPCGGPPRLRRDRAAQGVDHAVVAEAGRPGTRQPDRHAVARHRGQRRRAVRPRRVAAGRGLAPRSTPRPPARTCTAWRDGSPPPVPPPMSSHSMTVRRRSARTTWSRRSRPPSVRSRAEPRTCDGPLQRGHRRSSAATLGS